MPLPSRPFGGCWASRILRPWLSVLFVLRLGAASPTTAADEQPTSRPFHFETDVVPILSRFGCNASGCHGKAEGQNGFKLSVFGFDPVADRVALAVEGRGRRTSPALPEKSLLLQKACGDMPHGGGVRIRKSTDEYRTLANWIAAGLPFGEATAPRVVSITVSPREQVLGLKAQQPLKVVAKFDNGFEENVTRHAKFQSNNDGLASVDEFGVVATGETPGDVAIMASYLGAVDVFRAMLPRPFVVPPSGGTESPASNDNSKAPPEGETTNSANFIDDLVAAKLRKLNIQSSALCSDSDFLRRAYLDVIGTLPTADEVRAFLADQRPDRRARLIDELLKRPEYADYWALKWSDWLRVERQTLGHAGAHAYYRWIRDSFATNKPWDQFARELLTAEGLLRDAPAGYLFKSVTQPGEQAATVSQVLLGVRIDCAKCHHHPFDRWSQQDYFGMEAFFTQVGFKPTPQGELLSPRQASTTRHPRTGEEVFAHALGEPNPSQSLPGDRRRLLADWMTAPQNPFFARNFVNRVWAAFLGRGLVEPIDDVRLTNPPTNPELLDALAKHFIESKFDTHKLIRTITASRTYQLSVQPNSTNEKDEQNYSRALLKRLDAEVLFDAVCQSTGVPEKFNGMPDGYRAIQLWDSQVNHYFLKLFGRPIRVTACECERAVEPSVSQVLHVLNSPELQAKLSHEAGNVARLVRRNPSDNSALVDDLYVAILSRRPTADEESVATKYLQDHHPTRRQAAEDLAWSLLNSLEFVFNH
jgi:uncharacterized protein DUF1549/uncharacterized protein DUF1553